MSSIERGVRSQNIHEEYRRFETGMANAKVFIVFWSKAWREDPRGLLQLGMAIARGLAIVVADCDRTPLPPDLAVIARAIVPAENTEQLGTVVAGLARGVRP